MSTFVTPSALDTDRIAKLLSTFTHESKNMYTKTILVPYNVHVTLTHLFILGHLFFQVREPALGITYITDIPEPIVLDDLHKIRDFRRYKHQTCRICPMVTDNFCRFLVFSAKTPRTLFLDKGFHSRFCCI